MSSALPRYLLEAVKAARENNESYDEHLEYHLAAVLVKGGQVLSTGFNGSRPNSFTRTFAASDHVFSTHAECDAILRARRKIDLRGSKMYVGRISKKICRIGLARPCDMCFEAARLYGIKRVYYTIDDSTYAVTRL